MQTNTAPRTQRQQQAAARREQLLEVALDQFAEKGVRGSTIREIAQAAGITEGLIYHYFPSKTALLEAVVERYSLSREVVTMLPSVAHLPVREALVDLGRQFLRLLESKERFVRMVFSDAHRDPELAEALDGISNQGFEMTVQFLQERIDRGELKPHDPVVSLRLLHHTLVWYFLSRGVCEPAATATSPEVFVRDMVNVVLDGIAEKTEPVGPAAG
jgi:AcrR family transcriptional regulator